MALSKIRILSSVFLLVAFCILAGEWGLGAQCESLGKPDELKLGMSELAFKRSNLFFPIKTSRQFEDPHIYQSRTKSKSGILCFSSCQNKKCICVDLFPEVPLDKSCAMKLLLATFPEQCGVCIEHDDTDIKAMNFPSEFFYWQKFGGQLIYKPGTNNIERIHSFIRK